MLVRWKKLLRKWIPGIISGGADNDPSGITTYALSGAKFGYQQLWLILLSTPMLIAIQAMCARLGDIQRKGLMTIIKNETHPIVAVIAALILVGTNIATLTADLAAVADAIALITHTPYIWWIIPITILIWWVVVFNSYKVIEKFLFFLTFIFLSYVVVAFLAKPDWLYVIGSIFIPKISFTSEYLITAISLLGTTITPFLFFWQSKQRVEEKKSKIELLHEANLEDMHVAPGFIYSNIISLFITVSAASVLHTKGITDLKTAGDTARVLEPLAGSYASYLFALGIIGAGLLAAPVLAASTAYVIAEVFSWRDSLSESFDHAKGFYGVLSLSFILAAIFSLTGIDPIHAVIYSQALAGMFAPVLIAIILWLCNNKKIMGSHVNGRFDNIFGIITMFVMIGITIGIFWH